MTIDVLKLKTLVQALGALIDEGTGSPPGTFFGQPIAPGGNEQMLEQYTKERAEKDALPHPFGQGPDGTPLYGPATNGLKRLWQAARSVVGPDGKPLFDIYDYVPGVTYSGDVPRQPKYGNDVAKLEADVIEFSKTPWARFWMSFDVNAVLVDPTYQRAINWYVVKKNPDDTYSHVA